ncbi:MAG: hypothetical protein ABTQ34_06500 [Bdellovibrionales bacterium]
MAYSTLTADQIIDLMMEVIYNDHTAATPYFGHAHLYSGPRYEIHDGGKNIVNYEHERDNNHKRAKFLAPIFGARLIDDMNISKLVLDNINGTGKDIYTYMKMLLPIQRFFGR